MGLYFYFFVLAKYIVQTYSKKQPVTCPHERPTRTVRGGVGEGGGKKKKKKKKKSRKKRNYYLSRDSTDKTCETTMAASVLKQDPNTLKVLARCRCAYLWLSSSNVDADNAVTLLGLLWHRYFGRLNKWHFHTNKSFQTNVRVQVQLWALSHL